MKSNIAFVIYSLSSGGAERVVSTLANGMCNHYNVTIITFVKTKPFYKIDNRVEIVSCFENLIPSNGIYESLKKNFKLYKSIKKISDDLSIHLLIGFMTTTNVLTILAAKTLGLPVIVSERNYPPFTKISKFWHFLRKLSYPRANKLVVQTEPILKYFTSYLNEEKLIILPNPISKNFSDEKVNPDLKINNVILNVGSLTFQKGQDIAIKAFALINPPNWELHLVGEGPKREEYLNLIEKLGMKEKIKLLGRKKQISKAYLSSKIFVFPSRFEGFPNALTEAMYMGLPCIATDCPTGPSELITNGKNGYLVPIDDTKQFAKKLDSLISNATLRVNMGRLGAESVVSLEERNVVAKWERLIEQTIIEQ